MKNKLFNTLKIFKKIAFFTLQMFTFAGESHPEGIFRLMIRI